MNIHRLIILTGYEPRAAYFLRSFIPRLNLPTFYALRKNLPLPADTDIDTDMSKDLQLCSRSIPKTATSVPLIPKSGRVHVPVHRELSDVSDVSVTSQVSQDRPMGEDRPIGEDYDYDDDDVYNGEASGSRLPETVTQHDELGELHQRGVLREPHERDELGELRDNQRDEHADKRGVPKAV